MDSEGTEEAQKVLRVWGMYSGKEKVNFRSSLLPGLGSWTERMPLPEIRKFRLKTELDEETI